MKIFSHTIIVSLSYIICEIYKLIFKNRKYLFKFIPVLSCVIGGIVNLLLYYIDNEIFVVGCNELYVVFTGIISGCGSTGVNQIIKQLFKNKRKEEI